MSSTGDEHDGPGNGADWPPGEQPLDVRVRQVWTAQSAITTAVMALVVLGAEMGARLAGLEGWPTGLGAALVALIGGVLTWRLPSATWRRWRLELAPEALELRHGVVTFIHSAIPYHRVQYIDLKSGPIERAFGLTRLVVHTAAASTDAEIPGLATPRAEALRRVLLERAGVGDAV